MSGSRVHRFACLTALATFLLIVAGGLVTSTGSGLAVPDWPLSYGQLMPPMVGGIFYEHGHRMIAGVVAAMTLVLAVWLAAVEPGRRDKALGFAALGAVVLQAVLGGLTVLYLLPTWISVAHACLAQTFFCLVTAAAAVTSPRWTGRAAEGAGPRVLSVAAFLVVWLQLLIGALMRHTDSGLAIPDFPLAFGRVLPPHWDGHIAIHFAHRAWGLIVVGVVGVLAVRLVRGARSDLRRPALVLLVLLPLQVLLGGLAVISLKQAAVTTAHVATGALILASTLLIAVRARVLPAVEVGAPAAARAGASDLSPAAP